MLERKEAELEEERLSIQAEADAVKMRANQQLLRSMRARVAAWQACFASGPIEPAYARPRGVRSVGLTPARFACMSCMLARSATFP